MTRISAIILGVIGGLIIIRPTFEEFNLFYFMPLIFAFGFAQVALAQALKVLFQKLNLNLIKAQQSFLELLEILYIK